MAELPLVGEEFAGYRLVSVLGRGGMSIVFRAENPRLGNVIALKVLDPSLANDDIFRTRFLEESRIAASMNHPNVIPIHDMGSSDGLLYIAMRCVTGTDLRQMLKKRGRLPAEMAVFLLEQAARALDAAHRRGLVHRDVKPGNLLVERGNEGSDPEHVYLADFGITKHLSGRTGLTSSGQFLGTIDYVAPEQIRGISVLGLADQYSLGCVLYESLTGRVPFEKDLDAAIIWAHVEESPTLPTVLRPDLPPALDEVFARVLAKNPSERYESCKDFMTAAREALGPMADPPSASGSLPMRLPRSRPEPYPAEPETGAYLGAQYGPQPGAYQGGQYGSQPEAYPPTELAHESAPAYQAPTANWPVVESAPPPPPPGRPSVPGPPRGGGGRSARRRRRRGWMLVALVLLLVAGGAAGVTLSLTGGKGTPVAGGKTPTTGTGMSSGSSMASPTTSGGMASMGASAPAKETARTANCAPDGSVAAAAKNLGQSGPTTLTGVLQQANLCSSPANDLPPSKCQASNPTLMVCTAPVSGLAKVSFQTYASRAQLYSAYETQVKVFNGSYQSNTMTHCGPTSVTYAETAWNHLELHPTQYSVQQMESSTFNQVNAMGRQACFMSGGKPYLVWTTDVGNMLAVAQGTGSMSALYNWWAQIHHVIIFRGTEMCGQDMGRMGSVPQGNLISAPVCPTGVAPGGGAKPSASSTGMSGM
ncbi:MAG TPA: serine/threonine-protein kinase [Trebonia sp.]|jgi:serine/threonine-protein kinase